MPSSTPPPVRTGASRPKPPASQTPEAPKARPPEQAGTSPNRQGDLHNQSKGGDSSGGPNKTGGNGGGNGNDAGGKGSGGGDEQNGKRVGFDEGALYNTLEQAGGDQAVRVKMTIDGSSPGDVPVPTPERLQTDVAEILQMHERLQRFPEHMRRFIQKRIDTLPYEQQVEIARQVNEWASSKEVRKMVKHLSSDHQNTPDRVKAVMKDFDSWIERTMERLQDIEKARAIHTGDREGDAIVANAQQSVDATKAPRPVDRRTPEERKHAAQANETEFAEAVQKEANRKKERHERRILYTLIIAQIAVSAIHASIDPER